jgi:hypothetical protein
VSRGIAYGGSGDGAYWAENHRAGEGAQDGIAGPFLCCRCHRQQDQSGDTYDSKALHHFPPLAMRHASRHMSQSLNSGAGDGAFKPACGKLTYPCAFHVAAKEQHWLGVNAARTAPTAPWPDSLDEAKAAFQAAWGRRS